MILNIVVNVRDDADRNEVDFAIREAGRVASNDVYLNGVPVIDESRTLTESMTCFPAVEASYNRSE